MNIKPAFLVIIRTQSCIKFTKTYHLWRGISVLLLYSLWGILFYIQFFLLNLVIYCVYYLLLVCLFCLSFFSCQLRCGKSGTRYTGKKPYKKLKQAFNKTRAFPNRLALVLDKGLAGLSLSLHFRRVCYRQFCLNGCCKRQPVFNQWFK